MKKVLVVALSAILALSALCSIPVNAQSGPANLSRLGSLYFAGQYNQQLGTVLNGNTATGAATITVYAPYTTLRDGRVILPFSTSNPLTIDFGSNAETVTPSAVSGCTIAAQIGTCSITATFSNTHGQGVVVFSGSAGLDEAAADAAANGGGQVVIDGSFTGSTANITSARALYANVSINDLRPNSASAGAPVTLVGIGTGVATASQTLFLVGPGAATNAFTNTTATNSTFVAPRAGTLRNLSCTATAAGTAVGSGVVTVRTAPLSTGTFASSTITATFGQTTAAADSTHTAAVTAGQPIQIQVTTQATETLAGVACSVQLN